jgi:hypothetical protein
MFIKNSVYKVFMFIHILYTKYSFMLIKNSVYKVFMFIKNSVYSEFCLQSIHVY